MLTISRTVTGPTSRYWRLGTRRATGLALAAGLLLGTGTARGNNIRVTNLTWLATGVTGHSEVRFDLSWANSWRAAWTEPAATNVTGQALPVQNWDAAWVFVKFQPAGASNGYSHATLSTNAADHTVPDGTGGVAMTNAVGLTDGKGVGVFIYRAADGDGNNDISGVRLLWRNHQDGVTNGAFDIRVHAIEMVYVDEGPFALGSAGGTEDNHFYRANDTNQPYIVTNDVAIAVSSNAVAGNLWASGEVQDSTVISNAFPKGYAAFYGMKYEVTQGQYADFLNALSSADADAHYPDQNGNDRHTISRSGSVYSAQRPDRVCNYLAWSNGVAYAAWAALRPMSELEYSKACRGPLTAVANEYAWGTATIFPGTVYYLSGAENGTETVTNDMSLGGSLFLLGGSGWELSGGDSPPDGPLRAGVFATDSSTRVSSGATYWGIMDVVGSVYERGVTIANAAGRGFRGTHGAGTLDLPPDWPQNDALGSGVMGSCWKYASEWGQQADRSVIAWVTPPVDACGMRCVRTADDVGGPAGGDPDARFRGGAYDGYALGTAGGATKIVPASIYNQPVANVTTNAAVFHGWLLSTGSSATAVCVLWGESTNAWAHTNGWAAGAWADDSYPTTNIAGLAANTTYYYTFGASNEAGLVVAGPPVCFTSRGIHGAWWQNPSLKYTEDTGAVHEGGGPHFMNTDESDQYLFFPSGFYPSEAGVLYRVRDLVNATSAGQVDPIASTAPETFYGADSWDDAWRGGGLSDDLGRILPGNYHTNRNTSLPLTPPWTKDVNVFTITNDGAPLSISALDFSHDSTRLYSSVYRAAPDTDTGKLYEWNVGSLRGNGIGLTSNAVLTTSVAYIENPSVYYIGGKDLVYYGEGDQGGKACVYDTVAGSETVLINSGLPSGSQSNAIMNVKVGGVGLGQMHLYVQLDGGSLYIYPLNADGKSVGALAKSFTASELQDLLGATWTYMRCFEVMNDETHAFFGHHASHGGDPYLLHVVWASGTAHGTPRAWLDRFGLANYENDDLLDQDEDGLFTWQEYIAGTDPTNRASVFAVLDIGTMSGSNCVTFYGTTNGVTLPFSIYRSTNLLDSPAWQLYSTQPRDPSGTNVWWDTDPPVEGTPVFYRPVATNAAADN